jgi:hypothetical protein
MSKKAITFDLYRYQLLPKTREVQTNFATGVSSTENLLARKNEFFAELLIDQMALATARSTIRTMLLHKEDMGYLYKFAVNRALVMEKEDFTAEAISNWPSFYVLVFNHPDEQLIAVQKRVGTFNDTEVVIDAMMSFMEAQLAERGLITQVSPLFHEAEFWTIVNRFPNRVQEIEFDLITPNMTDISKVLSEELKEFAFRTNTVRTKMGLTADKDSALQIREDDPNVESLVQYASEGGGNIKLKIRGLKRIEQTKTKKRQLEVESADIEAKSPEAILEIFRGMIQ